MKTFLNRLGSIKITLWVLLLLAGAAAIGTFLPQGGDMEAWESLAGATGTRIAVALGLTDFYHSPWFVPLLVVLVVNLLACMASRLPGILSSLSGKAALGREAVADLPDSEESRARAKDALRSLGFRRRKGGGDPVYSRGGAGFLFTLLTHGSVLVIMAFSVFGSLAGFIATQRIYVGDSTRTAFNWKEKADRPLPFEIHVRDLAVLPHPVGVRLGVLEAATGRKGKLITTHEGGVFTVPGLEGRFALDRFDVDTKDFKVIWTRTDGSALAVGSRQEIGSSGLALVPVAFAAWPERQVTTRIAVVSPEAGERSGEISINHPMVTEGIRIYLTDYGKDKYGLPYVGFQFVRDPGQAGVWVGSVLFLLCVSGAVLWRHSCAVLVRDGGRLRIHLSSRENREKIAEQIREALVASEGSTDGGAL